MDIHYTSSVDSTESHDYDNEIPSLVSRKTDPLESPKGSFEPEYHEAEPVAIAARRPVCLAFSNPGSDDDGVRIPSVVLSRLSVESV